MLYAWHFAKMLFMYLYLQSLLFQSYFPNNINKEHKYMHYSI